MSLMNKKLWAITNYKDLEQTDRRQGLRVEHNLQKVQLILSSAI